jgi:hypothetical protein
MRTIHRRTDARVGAIDGGKATQLLNRDLEDVMSELTVLFDHIPHPRTRARVDGNAPPPPKVDDARVGINGRIGLFITTVIGTMWAAYLFTLLALVSFPSAIRSGDKIIIVAWIAQTFLQLVLLPVIIVGQNLQSKAADKRAEQTYNDAEAVLHECLQIQAHLGAQDDAYNKHLVLLTDLVAQVRGTPPADPASN